MTDGYTDAQRHEANELGSALVANEAGRDAFLAVAHTTLFAASIAFVGDVTPLDTARYTPLLVIGWLASVIGLCALTYSFSVASNEIEARRAHILAAERAKSQLLNVLNSIALWSFPTALILVFAFTSINVVTPMRGRFIHPGMSGIGAGVMPGGRLPTVDRLDLSEVLETRGIKPPSRLPPAEVPSGKPGNIRPSSDQLAPAKPVDAPKK